MKKRFFVPALIFLITIVFFYGLSVGVYKIFPYELLDSSADVLSEQKTVENNQFIKQANVGSLIKIDAKSDIDEKRKFLTEFFWGVGTLQRIVDKSPLPDVESDISDSRYNNFQNLKRIDRLVV